MSPNSSSRCLAGRNARSAVLRTIIPLTPPSRFAIGGSANSTRCAPCAPPSVVSWRHREGASLSGSRASRRLRRARRIRLRRPRAPGRARTRRHVHFEGPPRELPRQAIDGPPGEPRARDPQHGRPHGADRGGLGRLLRLHLRLPPSRLRPASRLDHRTGTRPDLRPPRAERGGQPARRRRDGLRQHLGARPARGRAHRDLPLEGDAGDGRRAHGALHRRRRPRRQGQGPTRLGGPVRGSFTADIAPAPPSKHIDPSTGRIVAGTYPSGQ